MIYLDGGGELRAEAGGERGLVGDDALARLLHGAEHRLLKFAGTKNYEFE